MKIFWVATVVGLLAIAVTLYFVPDEEEEAAQLVVNTRRSSNPVFDALVRWIRRHGGTVDDRITWRNGPLGRGLFLDGGDVVVEDGSADPEPLYSVPEAVYLSTETILYGHSVMQPILADSVFHDWFQHDTVMLSVALLAERNAKNSFWKPYIDTLPATYDEQALFWSEEELDELQSPFVVKQIQTSQTWLRGHHGKLMQLLERHPTRFPKEKSATIVDDFIWAYYTVTSHGFDTGRAGTDDGQKLGLVPFVDLLNHAFEMPTVQHRTTVVLPADNAFFTGMPYQNRLAKGTELTWQYSRHAASMKYFLMYGMLPANTDTYTQGDYIALQIRDQIWLVDQEGHVDPAVFDFVEAEKLSIKVNDVVGDFATTLEEDKAALVSPDLSPAQRVALLLRVRYKQIIHKLKAWLADENRPTDNYLAQGELKFSQALFLLVA